MSFLVATNVVASRYPERRPTGTPHARANCKEENEQQNKAASGWNCSEGMELRLGTTQLRGGAIIKKKETFQYNVRIRFDRPPPTDNSDFLEFHTYLKNADPLLDQIQTFLNLRTY